MRTMPAKTYVDLKKEVWESGKCSGCGGCVAVCPADAITFPEQGDNKAPVQSGYCKQETDGVTVRGMLRGLPKGYRTDDRDPRHLSRYCFSKVPGRYSETPERWRGNRNTHACPEYRNDRCRRHRQRGPVHPQAGIRGHHIGRTARP